MRSPDGFPHGHGPDAAEDEQRDEGDRRLDEEDRLPAERLSENPARSGPERSAEHPCKRPDARGGSIGPHHA